MTKTIKLDSFTRSYVETALWLVSGPDGEPTDDEYTVEDIDDATMTEMVQDCQGFANGLSQGLYDMITTQDDGWERAGHDFFLTRNRHGAGFWDGDWPADAGRKLTQAAHTYGTFQLVVGEDGKVYHHN